MAGASLKNSARSQAARDRIGKLGKLEVLASPALGVAIHSGVEI